MSDNLYPYTPADFERLPARELQAGQYISISGSNGYGVLQVDEVTHAVGNTIVVQCRLPVGMDVYSSETKRVWVTWEGTTPVIRVLWYYPGYDILMVRRQP